MQNIKLDYDKEAAFERWQKKLQEVQDSGNCLNEIGGQFFSPRLSQEQKEAYCERKINQIRLDILHKEVCRYADEN